MRVIHTVGTNFSFKQRKVNRTNIGTVVAETDGGSRNASANSRRAAPSDNR